MVLRSMFPDQPIVDRPVHQMLLDAMQQYSNDTCLIDGTTGDTVTFGALRAQCYSVATALVKAGFKKGDVISLSLPNCNEYIPLNVGILMSGGVASLLNPAYQTYELEHYIGDSGSCAAITSPLQLDAFCKVAQKFTHLKKCTMTFQTICVWGTFDASVYRRKYPRLTFARVEDILATPPDFDVPLPRVHTRTDMTFLLYSSGTTGLPKAVMHSHYTVSALTSSIRNRAWFLWPTRDDTALGFLPYFHIYGLLIWAFMILDGVPQVTIPKFDPIQFLEVIQKYRIRYLHIVPPVMVFLAKHPVVDKYDLRSLLGRCPKSGPVLVRKVRNFSCVEGVLVGAAPVGKELSLELSKRLPNIHYVLQGYGMSEHGVSHVTPPALPEGTKHGSVGVVTCNYEVKIVDTESGVELVGPHKTGELCVRTPGIMLGYLNRPEQTRDTIDTDGWLHTGDIGYYDEDEYWYIVDRKKELIKVKGFQVAPAELEDVLLQQPAVADAAVVGVDDERAGELPVAFVVLKASHPNTTAQQLQDAVNGQRLNL